MSYYNNHSNNTNRSGVSAEGALQIVFLVLKLTGLINWPWFYVFLPTIISLVLTVTVLGFVFLKLGIFDDIKCDIHENSQKKEMEKLLSKNLTEDKKVEKEINKDIGYVTNEERDLLDSVKIDIDMSKYDQIKMLKQIRKEALREKKNLIKKVRRSKFPCVGEERDLLDTVKLNIEMSNSEQVKMLKQIRNELNTDCENSQVSSYVDSLVRTKSVKL